MTSLKTKKTQESTLDWIQRIREKVYRDTRGMSHEEFSEYIRQGGESFRQEMKKRQAVKEEKKSQ